MRLNLPAQLLKGYQNHDLDFVTSADPGRLGPAMATLGFVQIASRRLYAHPQTDWLLEFPSAPLGFGHITVDARQLETLRTPWGALRVMDQWRLAVTGAIASAGLRHSSSPDPIPWTGRNSRPGRSWKGWLLRPRSASTWKPDPPDPWLRPAERGRQAATHHAAPARAQRQCVKWPIVWGRWRRESECINPGRSRPMADTPPQH